VTKEELEKNERIEINDLIERDGIRQK